MSTLYTKINSNVVIDEKSIQLILENNKFFFLDPASFRPDILKMKTINKKQKCEVLWEVENTYDNVDILIPRVITMNIKKNNTTTKNTFINIR